MNVEELKKQIENKTLGDQFLILKYQDSTFLAHQYIEAIAAFKNLEIVYVDEVGYVPYGSGHLQVAFLDEFTDEMYGDFLTNFIVVCKKVGMGGQPSTIEFPPLEDWQIEDYVRGQLEGVETKYISWLCKVAKYDIQRLQLEIDKLKIFPRGMQQSILMELSEVGGYVDLSDLSIYDVVRAVTTRDVDGLREYFRDEVRFDILGLVALLIRNFRQILDIQINPLATAETLGISFKQFKAVQNSCGHYTNSQLIAIYEFLIKIDAQLKLGQVDIGMLKEYVIPHILSIQEV